MRPLAIDLCCGVTGWGHGLIDAGFHVLGFDIEDMFKVLGEDKPEHFALCLQDIRSLHGSQFKGASLIVASPPCQFYSYTAMPWSRAKALAAEVRADPIRLEKELELFKTCFRIQREASQAKGEHIPMVVENVRGAIPWVGRSRANFGSYHFWADVPALMPTASGRSAQKVNPDGTNHGTGSWFAIADSKERGSGRKVPGFRFDGSGGSFQSASVSQGAVQRPARTGDPERPRWFNDGPRQSDSLASSSSSPRRKAASAKIAMIPLAVSRHIGRTFLPSPSPQRAPAESERA